MSFQSAFRPNKKVISAAGEGRTGLHSGPEGEKAAAASMTVGRLFGLGNSRGLRQAKASGSGAAENAGPDGSVCGPARLKVQTAAAVGSEASSISSFGPTTASPACGASRREGASGAKRASIGSPFRGRRKG